MFLQIPGWLEDGRTVGGSVRGINVELVFESHGWCRPRYGRKRDIVLASFLLGLIFILLFAHKMGVRSHFFQHLEIIQTNTTTVGRYIWGRVIRQCQLSNNERLRHCTIGEPRVDGFDDGCV